MKRRHESIRERMGEATTAPGGHLPGNVPDPTMVGGADFDPEAGDRHDRTASDAAGDSSGTAGAGSPKQEPPPQR